MADPTVVRLRMHLRKMLIAGDESTALVHCPKLGRSRDAGDCLHCKSLLSRWWDAERGGDIGCTAGIAERHGSDTDTDFAEAAVRAAVHQALGGATYCVPPGALAEQVVRQLHGTSSSLVAVVNAEAHVLGIASKRALVGLPSGTRVSDAMSVPQHVLLENAPVAHAIALMAFEDVNAVPVVTEEDELVGLLLARDLLRWTAERLGYDGASPRGEQSTSAE